MVAPIDVSGERYGRLTAVRRIAPKNGKTFWLFRCDCGKDYEARLENVRHSHTRSCGCQKTESIRQRSLRHGHQTERKESRTLKSYRHAKSRCENVNDPKFPLYGGRGIKMCKQWAEDFSTFLADMGECPLGRTLDRVDVDGHYEPRNCRWATPMQQARTRSDNVLVEHDGQTMVLKDYASLMGVSYKALHRRYRTLGQPLIEATKSLMK